jgi:acyl phosphate:glycerol-3-phosphate acyltransferase
LVGRIFLHKDIRDYGDGAPGATNVARAGNKTLFVISALMDGFKGTIPVWLAQYISGISGWELAAVSIAPVIAHAFTPILKFKGGMGVAPTFGVWLGLLGWLGPVVIGLCIGIIFIFLQNRVWASISGIIGLLIFLIVLQFPMYLSFICLIHMTIQTGKRISYFKHSPELQPWIERLRGKA